MRIAMSGQESESNAGGEFRDVNRGRRESPGCFRVDSIAAVNVGGKHVCCPMRQMVFSLSQEFDVVNLVEPGASNDTDQDRLFRRHL
jgi:hypothetical protein